MFYKFTIAGRPVVQKNNQQIRKNRRTGKRWVAKSDQAETMQAWAVCQLKKQWAGRPTLTNRWMNAAIVSYLAKGQKPDASNLYELPQDALEAAGIISNDYFIRTHNGSDRVPFGEHGGDPRIEITITEWGEVHRD